MKTKKKIILPKIKSKPKYTIELDEDQMYSLGGWLKENAVPLATTVAGAAMTATGVGAGAGIPMMVSGGAGLLGNALADDPETTDYSDELRMPRTVGKENMTPNVMSFGKGGKMKTVMNEWDRGQLNIGKSNKKVPHTKKGQKQAIAIALSYKNKKGLGGELSDPVKNTNAITTVTKANWRPLTDLEFIQSTGIDRNEFYKTTPEERVKFVPNDMFKAMKGKKGSTANQGGMQYFQNVPMDMGTDVTNNGKVVLQNPGLAYIKNNYPNHPVYAIGGNMMIPDQFGGEGEQQMGNEELMQLEGPKHEQGGIQFTPDAELEGGESVYKDVVNSDQIKITKEIANQYGLPKSAINKTPAEYSNLIEKNYKGREVDPFAQTSKEMELNNLAKMSTELAELYKQNTQQDQVSQMRYGGKLKYGIGGYDDPKMNYDNPNGPSYINQVLMNMMNRQKTRLDPMLNQYGVDTKNTEDYFDDSGRHMRRFKQPNNNTNIEPFTIYNKGPIRLPEISNNNKNTSNNVVSNLQTNYKLPDLSYNAPDDYMNVQSDFGSLINNKQSNVKFSNSLDDPNSSLFNPTKSKENSISGLKSSSTNNTGNTLNSILGAVPMAINAYQSARTAKEGYDKVKLARMHTEPFNPEFIDPSYQLQQVGDTFATANESMDQQSRTDYLRRRIQSATEESKVKSGILGQVAGVNTQMLNQAKQYNIQNQSNVDRTNIEVGLQEENINAANKGTWQTSRDYQLNNLGSMIGEYARDRRLTNANEDYNDRMFSTMEDMFPGQTVDRIGKWSNTGEGITPIVNSPYINTYNRNNDPHTYNPSNYIYGEETELGPGISNYPNWVTRNTVGNRRTNLYTY